MVSAQRQRDVVRIEVIAGKGTPGGCLDRFTSFELRNDITMPSEASFEIGDDLSWSSLGNVFQIGTQFQVLVNDRPRMRGRVEMNNAPLDPGAGAVIRFAVRTKLSDAMFASASQTTRVLNVSIKDFILALYKPLGYLEKDFVFSQDAARNLLTGKDKRGGKPPTDLEPIKLDEARVKPPETIYAAADRHLRRHGWMHWDAPDGRIVVGAPNDEQDPTFFFNAYRTYLVGNPDTNNILSASRTRDWSGIPTTLGVYGIGGKRDFTKSRVAGVAVDLDLIRAGFYRPVTMVAEGVRTNDLAYRTALRDLAARSKSKDGFAIAVDGFSQWDGDTATLYSPDTVADIRTDVAGGEAGPYYIHATTMTRSADNGDTTQIEAVRRGIWRL